MRLNGFIFESGASYDTSNSNWHLHYMYYRCSQIELGGGGGPFYSEATPSCLPQAASRATRRFRHQPLAARVSSSRVAPTRQHHALFVTYRSYGLHESARSPR